MVEILPESPSFGTTFARGLGSGLGHGFSKGSDFASEILKEKIKRGLLLKESEKSIPNRFSSLGGSQLDTDNVSNSSQPIQGSIKGSAENKFMSPEEVQQEAANRTREKISRGVPTNFEDELATARQKNAEVAQYQRFQQEAGARSDETLAKLMPEATDEQKAILRRRAEQFAGQNLTPAEMDRKLALESKKFKNQILSVKNSIPPNRFFSRVGQIATGSNVRDQSKSRDSIRLKLKPLLEEGLYDTARDLLGERGYAPEEREEIISGLGEQAKKGLSSFEKVKGRTFSKEGFQGDIRPPTEKEQERFSGNIREILKSDPSTNLVLLRKAYENKGIDWKTFKNEIDSLMLDEQFEPSEDQMKMLDILDEPPLGRLDSMLHKFNLIGR